MTYIFLYLYFNTTWTRHANTNYKFYLSPSYIQHNRLLYTFPFLLFTLDLTAHVFGRRQYLNPLFFFNNFLQFVMVILKGSVEISFAGSKEPASYAEIVSMGGINSEVKKKLIATIGTILQSKLSIPRTRFFLKVYDTTVGRNYSKIWQPSTTIYARN